MPNAVEATNLVRWLPLAGERIDILRGVSFTIPRSSWVALTGPSGSGKSTLLGILAGIDTVNEGTLVIAGTDITTMNETTLARFRNEAIGIVFQSFNLIPTLTALENVEVPLYVSRDRRHIRQRAREMLDRVGLSDRLHHRPHQLSGGQQQRVAIARALVTNPALVLADEPTGNLDSQIGAQVLDLFAQLRAELGITLVVATHDPLVAARADTVLTLIDGRLATPGNGHQEYHETRLEPIRLAEGV
ncbi:MAG: ABC transporter ATP-binding protein [Anaerolineae bacterium]|nr:ABC transporter ATP-binding protein [Anaerolineae bacterium]